jgi:WhiB family redox-sensing transcriptional regulator
MSVVRPNWMQHARCKDVAVNMFYPTSGAPTGHLRKLCNTCPVRTECLTYALDNGEEYGVWGGTSERQRRRMLRGETG